MSGVYPAMPDYKHLPGGRIVAVPDKWRTKDGRILNITDIEDDHLRNIIAMVERKFTPLIKYEMAAIVLGDPWFVSFSNNDMDDEDIAWRGLCALRDERTKREKSWAYILKQAIKDMSE